MRAAPKPVKPEATELDGHLDRIENGWLFGWAWRVTRPDQPLDIDVYVDGTLEVTASAALYRPDLESARKGNGRHAFEIPLPGQLSDGRPHHVRVCYGGTAIDLHGSPRPFSVAVADGGQTATSPVPGPRFRSRFGGLWTELSTALDVIAGKAALGWISPAEAVLLRQWVKCGYVVLRQAVSAELIDRLDAEVERIWAGTTSVRAFVEFWEGGDARVYPAGPRFRDRPCKMLDLHAHLETARQVMFAPGILRLLALLFERPAVAFQSLYFRWGSRQAIHQDTAFVRVSSPLEFAASWVALEDIQPDSGELEYFVGSHTLEDYLFEGGHKWMPTKSAEYDRYIAALRRNSEARGLRRERFLPKKGDVLLWAADLAHGGSQDVRPGVTRRSLVTHYCPVSCEPIDSGGGGDGSNPFGTDPAPSMRPSVAGDPDRWP
jgi:phytanoyl-CoA hydroxylase